MRPTFKISETLRELFECQVMFVEVVKNQDRLSRPNFRTGTAMSIADLIATETNRLMSEYRKENELYIARQKELEQKQSEYRKENELYIARQKELEQKQNEYFEKEI